MIGLGSDKKWLLICYVQVKVGFRHTHCYLEIYAFKTIRLFLGVRKDVFRSLLKSLLSRGWAMFTFLSDAMFLTIFVLKVAMFWQNIKVSWTKQGWNMIFHTKFRMLLDWTPLHYAKQGQPPKMFRWMGSTLSWPHSWSLLLWQLDSAY